jgi:hypothetical protein
MTEDILNSKEHDGGIADAKTRANLRIIVLTN